MLRLLSTSLWIALFAAVVFSQTPPCALFTQADVVFAGRVAAIENAQKSEDLPSGTKKTRFQVTENFKGADNPTFTLFSTGETPLKKGQTWIIFAATDIVLKNFSIIGRNEVSPDSLAELKRIATTDEFGSVGGRLMSTMSSEELKSVTVTLKSGTKSLTTRPDSSGVFRFAAPDGGRFRVEFTFPFNTSLKWPDTLLGVKYEKGSPTIFGYDVKTNSGDCNYVEFEILP